MSTNTRVDIAGVTVSPRDLVLADGSGIVVIGSEHEEDVLREAGSIAAREERVADEIRAGRPISEAMAGGYESMLDRTGDT